MPRLENVQINAKPIKTNASVEGMHCIAILVIFVKIKMQGVEIVKLYADKITRINVCVEVYKFQTAH